MAASTRFSRLWLSMPPMIGRPSMTMVLKRSWVGTRLTRPIFPSDVVTQVGHQPAFADLDILALAPAVALDLIAVDLAHGKVLGLGMGEIPAADCRRGEHGVMLGQGHTTVTVPVQQLEQRRSEERRVGKEGRARGTPR